MGAGTNVQERIVGLHHIDAPWKPSDLEQREGRAIRRDNKLYERDPDGFEVAIYRYATRQTYDTRRWQLLEHKARGIAQLRKYDGQQTEIEDIDGEAANAAEMKAAASGDPLILRETQLRHEVRRTGATGTGTCRQPDRTAAAGAQRRAVRCDRWSAPPESLAGGRRAGQAQSHTRGQGSRPRRNHAGRQTLR